MTDEDVVDDEDTTTSIKTRLEWVGSAAALLLLSTSCLAVLVYVARGDRVPVWASASFTLSVLAAAAWTFGESALAAARKARGDGGS
jgi:hypothetical protein